MKYLIIILLLIPIFSNAQSVLLTDSVTPYGTNIRYSVTYNSTAYTNGDSISFRSSSTKKRGLVNPLALPINTATQTALDGKQPSGNYASGITNTGDNATNTQYSGLAASKQDVLVSGTTIKTVNGNTLLGSGNLVIGGGSTIGYTLSVQALTSSPVDAQTIYFGQLPKAPITTANVSKVYIRKAGTIKMAQVYCYSGTAGTAEAWIMNIRLNNTTDTQIASVAASASERIFTNSSLNIAVNAGDYIEIKCVNPTWATNPLTCIFGGYLYIE